MIFLPIHHLNWSYIQKSVVHHMLFFQSYRQQVMFCAGSEALVERGCANVAESKDNAVGHLSQEKMCSTWILMISMYWGESKNRLKPNMTCQYRKNSFSTTIMLDSAI